MNRQKKVWLKQTWMLRRMKKKKSGEHMAMDLVLKPDVIDQWFEKQKFLSSRKRSDKKVRRKLNLRSFDWAVA
jgi:hypothetical protein